MQPPPDHHQPVPLSVLHAKDPHSRPDVPLGAVVYMAGYDTDDTSRISQTNVRSDLLSHWPSFFRSTTTNPPFITHFTLSSTTPISAVGSPSTATRSAKYPGATAPSSFALPNNSAAWLVAVFNASSGVIPAFTNHPSSRVFCPNIV